MHTQLTQAWKFFARKPDGFSIKAVVILLLFLDSVAQIGEFSPLIKFGKLSENISLQPTMPAFGYIVS